MFNRRIGVCGLIQSQIGQRLAPALASIRQISLLNLQFAPENTQSSAELKNALIVGLHLLEARRALGCCTEQFAML